MAQILTILLNGLQRGTENQDQRQSCFKADYVK